MKQFFILSFKYMFYNTLKILNILRFSVVWKLGDNEMVERSVVEWGLLDFHHVHASQGILSCGGSGRFYFKIWVFSFVRSYISKKNIVSAFQLEVRKVSKMMCSDSSMDSHPIRRNVSNSPDITDLFDNISYEKVNAESTKVIYILFF